MFNLKIMEQFVLWGSYCEDALIKRKPFREEHLQRLSILKKEGVLISLGPTKCNRYVFGTKCTSPDKVTGAYEKSFIWSVDKNVSNKTFGERISRGNCPKLAKKS